MVRQLGRWPGAVMAAGLLAACGSDVAGPVAVRQPGVLMITGWAGNMPVDAHDGGNLEWNSVRGPGDYTAPDVLVAPDTVAAGVAFEVTTHTVGPSGCWRSDGQTVIRFGRTVVLKPYDAHSGSEACTGALVFPAHASTLVLDEPGDWTLRVDGRRLRMGDNVWDEPISAERTIVVR